MGTWWDPSGPEPGAKVGCYRMALDGRRFRAGEWTEGDGDLKLGRNIQRGAKRSARALEATINPRGQIVLTLAFVLRWHGEQDAVETNQ